MLSQVEQRFVGFKYLLVSKKTLSLYSGAAIKYRVKYAGVRPTVTLGSPWSHSLQKDWNSQEAASILDPLS